MKLSLKHKQSSGNTREHVTSLRATSYFIFTRMIIEYKKATATSSGRSNDALSKGGSQVT